MSQPPDLLTAEDVEWVFPRIVSEWFLDRLDTRLGTEEVVGLLKRHFSTVGGCGVAPDGPYSDGKNAEYWVMSFDVTSKKGAAIKIEHCVRKTDTRKVLREGRIMWGRLANIATLTAIERQRATSERGQVAASKAMRQMAFGEEES